MRRSSSPDTGLGGRLQAEDGAPVVLEPLSENRSLQRR